MSKSLFATLALCGILFLIALSLRGELPTLNSVAVVEGKRASAVTLPYYVQNEDTTAMHVVLHLSLSSADFAKFQIYPDDCLLSIKVNQKPISLADYSQEELCAYHDGFELDLSNEIAAQNVRIDLEIQNTISGGHGLRFELRQQEVLLSAKGLALGAVIVLLVFFFALSLGCSKVMSLIVGASTVLRYAYLAVTPYYLRTHDVLDQGGHLDYIVYIAKNAALPHFLAGWEYHQPPLYYLINAAICRFFNVDLFDGSMIFPQLITLFSMTVLLVFAGLIFERLLERRYALLAGLLLCFWSSSVVHSVRITNDVTSYAFSAMSLWFVVSYLSREKSKDLTFSAIAALFGVATKLTAGPVLIPLAIAHLHALFVVKPRLRLRVIFANTVIVALGFLWALYRSIPSYFYKNENLILGDTIAALNHHLFVGNEPWHYLIFDFKQFLTVPFANPWADSGGRQYVWSYLLKTSLFGEFSFDYPLNNMLALVMSAIALVVFIVVLINSIFILLRGTLVQKTMVIFLFVNLAMVIGYHIKVPAAASSEFRFIFPSVISVCYLFALAPQSIGGRLVFILSALTAVVWVAAASVFYLSLLP